MLEFKKPAGAQTWGGGFSNPNPTMPALSNDWLTLQPSLVSDAVQLGFATPVSGKVNIQVFDGTGKMVLPRSACSVPKK